MLDFSQLVILLEKNKSFLLDQRDAELLNAEKLWQQLCDDISLQETLQETSTSLLIPKWTENLGMSRGLHDNVFQYNVLALDGSQIYPDRHQQTSCALINVGGVFFSYGEQASSFERFSEPFLFSAYYRENHEVSVDGIDAHRNELELKKSLEYAVNYRKKFKKELVVFFDGALIFWHLVDKPRLQDYYLPRYCALLQKFYDERIALIGFISVPKSKDLINLIRMLLKIQNSSEGISMISDADFLFKQLKLYERTVIFESQVSLRNAYPSEMKPYFFYCHVGDEVVRVELPAWIVGDEERLCQIESIIKDQCIKGGGYPIALAEAHEAAVVKYSDQKMFFNLIQQITQQKNLSNKLQKKRQPLA